MTVLGALSSAVAVAALVLSTQSHADPSADGDAPPLWYGQHEQDRLVVEGLLGGLTGGFFVELGAVDGTTLSNTRALEERYGWNGLCIEPSLAYVRLLRSGRTCAKRGDVISGESGAIVEFVDQSDQGAGAGADVDADADAAAAVNAGRMEAPSSSEGLYSGILATLDAYSVVGSRQKRVTRTLAELLDEHHAPQNVDFLSLDTVRRLLFCTLMHSLRHPTFFRASLFFYFLQHQCHIVHHLLTTVPEQEGSEFDILRTFPWDRRCGNRIEGQLHVHRILTTTTTIHPATPTASPQPPPPTNHLYPPTS